MKATVLYLCSLAIIQKKLSYENQDKRAAGIEPASSAWKAEVLPLNYARARTKDLLIVGVKINLAFSIITLQVPLSKKE